MSTFLSSYLHVPRRHIKLFFLGQVLFLGLLSAVLLEELLSDPWASLVVGVGSCVCVCVCERCVCV